jgi:hypothetical protein
MSMNEISSHGNGGMTFAGPKGVGVFQALTLASGLRLYAETGVKPNRAWPPTAMLDLAARLTGVKYKRGQFEIAARDLTDLANQLRDEIAAEAQD